MVTRVKDFADRLNELKAERNLTDAELGKQLGFSQVVVNRWRTREREPKLSWVCRAADKLGVSLDWLAYRVQ